jgi:hypothetical protein
MSLVVARRASLLLLQATTYRRLVGGKKGTKTHHRQKVKSSAWRGQEWLVAERSLFPQFYEICGKRFYRHLELLFDFSFQDFYLESDLI